MIKETQAASYIAGIYRWAISTGLSHEKAIALIVKPKVCSNLFSDEFDRGMSGLRRDKRLQEYWRGGHEKFTIVWPQLREASKHDSIIIPPKRISTKDERIKQRRARSREKHDEFKNRNS